MPESKRFDGSVTWNASQIGCTPEYMYENGFEYNIQDIISVE